MKKLTPHTFSPATNSTASRIRTATRTALACTSAIALMAGLSACTNNSEKAGSTGNSAEPTEKITATKDDAVANMLPQKIKDKGTLTVGTSADYAPAEFVGSDGHTIEGFEVDIANAMAEVMGLKLDMQNATFDSILPAVGTKFDMGMASFSIRAERLQQVNMITLYDSGTAFGVAKGNPKKIDPTNLCGSTVAVQTGTVHEERINEDAKKCTGDKKLTIQSYKTQTDASTAVAGGKADVMVADSPVVYYAINQAPEKLEAVGSIVDKAPKAALISKSDDEMAKATQAAAQKIIDDGTMKKIMDKWGNDQSLVSKSELNPAPTE